MRFLTLSLLIISLLGATTSEAEVFSCRNLFQPPMSSKYSLRLAHKLNQLPKEFRRQFQTLWDTSKTLPPITTRLVKITFTKNDRKTHYCGICPTTNIGHINSITQRENPLNVIDLRAMYHKNTFVTENGKLLGSIKWGPAGNILFLALSNVNHKNGETIFIAGGVYQVPTQIYEKIIFNSQRVVELNEFAEDLYFYPKVFLQHPTHDHQFKGESYKGLILHLRNESLASLQQELSPLNESLPQKHLKPLRMKSRYNFSENMDPL